MSISRNPVAERSRSRSWRRAILPRGLFGRTFLILLVPLFVLQLVVALVFIQRHIDGITRQMTTTLAMELRGVARLAEKQADAPAIRHTLRQLSEGLEYDIGYLEGERISLTPRPPIYNLAERAIFDTLTETIGYPVSVDPSRLRKRVDVRIQLPEGVLLALPPERRLTASNPHFLLVWMVIAGLVLLLVAVLFLRNQVKPIRQLALAAEAFGKGQPVPSFRSSGAEEVRRAAIAFQTMRTRIERQIAQRTLMLSGVSHDLRTPLTRMRLALAMMDETSETEAMVRDVDQMERMVAGFLAFARGEDGEVAELVDLPAMLDEIVADARAVGHEIELLPVEGATSEMLLRPDALRRCIVNLIENAAKFAEHVWIGISFEQRRVLISIDDDGPGIPADQREEVLKPFFRGDLARNQDHGEGSGLGLSIARDIAHAHGGDILLGDSVHGGLRAVILLPR